MPLLSSLARLRWRKRLRALAATLMLAGLALAVTLSRTDPVATGSVVTVIDGDSLILRQADTPLTIRLAGIDAVEYRQDCPGDAARWTCGRDARSALETLVGSGPIRCELAGRDRYRRTLAACRSAARQGDEADLAAVMVRQGWAVATSDAYRIDEATARVGRRGIWRQGFTHPAEWRAAQAHPNPAPTLPGR